MHLALRPEVAMEPIRVHVVGRLGDQQAVPILQRMHQHHVHLGALQEGAVQGPAAAAGVRQQHCATRTSKRRH
eukprot:10998087-Prorocentrum_lima.AAC.1